MPITPSVAVSCTGTGEVFIRTLAAYDIAALMEYGNLSLYGGLRARGDGKAACAWRQRWSHRH
ncbi:isoaspartyl peptidase/L-asparaginase [Escherichia coli]